MPEPSLRLLGPGDETAVEIHLAPHWASSMMIRMNLRAGGLSDEGEFNQGTYAALFDGATILALAVHYREGTVMLQAPRAVGQVVRAATGESQRLVERIVGAWTQVTAAAGALGNDPKNPYTGRAETLATLDMAKLQIETVKRPDARARTATQADLATLIPWRAAFQTERAGLASQPTPDDMNAAKAALAQEIADNNLFVVESAPAPQSAPRLLAMASCEARLSDAVQIGAVWSPPALKDKGYAPLAVLGATLSGRDRGAKRAVLLSTKTDAKAQAAVRLLGFVAMDEFGTLTAPL